MIEEIKVDLDVVENLSKSLKAHELFNPALEAQCQTIVDKVRHIKDNLSKLEEALHAEETSNPFLQNPTPENPLFSSQPSRSSRSYQESLAGNSPELSDETKKLLEQYKDNP